MTRSIQPQAPSLHSIFLYPIKSTAGLSVSSAFAGTEGLRGDRRYMLVSADGAMITARTHPQLQQIFATPMEEGLRLTFQGLDPLILHTDEFSMTPMNTSVWDEEFTALRTHDEADWWLSQVGGEPVILLWLGQQSNRYRPTIHTSVSFADGFPFLLIGQASLADLNLRSGVQHQMSQFRPNLVVTGTLPYAEDSWLRIRIGTVEFKITKPCSRCVMTMIEPATGLFSEGNEPLATLTRYRQGEDGEVYFGQNLIALNEGTIEAGSQIEVLETTAPVIYWNTES